MVASRTAGVDWLAAWRGLPHLLDLLRGKPMLWCSHAAGLLALNNVVGWVWRTLMVQGRGRLSPRALIGRQIAPLQSAIYWQWQWAVTGYVLGW